MNYLSVCSGIEAASVAWHPLGWTAVAFSEIEPFPCAVLKHRYPNVPNLGDMTKYHEWPELNIDALVGGCPCQAFSVAGLREGLADPRGNLTLTFLGVAQRYHPYFVVYENVPGILSDRTNAFGCLLAGLAELGYGVAYRVLDAQYFGVAQRRKRVFVVGCLGGWERAAEVLSIAEGLCWHPAPGREAGKNIAGTITKGALDGSSPCGGDGRENLLVPDIQLRVAIPIQEIGKRQSGTPMNEVGHGADGDPMYTLQRGAVHGVAHSLRVEGFDASEDGTGRGTPLVPVLSPALKARDYKGPSSDGDGDGDGAPLIPVCFSSKDHGSDAGPLSPTLRAGNHTKSHANAGVPPAIAFHPTQDPISSTDGSVHALGCGSRGGTATGAVAFQEAQTGVREYAEAGTLRANGPGHDPVGTRIRQGMSVRRLTPVECERLQGFPDNWTDIPWRNKPGAPDGPRYKALGNSMAVPCMRKIGEGMERVGLSKCRIFNFDEA